MKIGRWAWAAGLAVAAGLIAGCGGAGGGSETGGGSGGSGGSGGGGARPDATARVDVNTATGEVKVTPLGMPGPGAPMPGANGAKSHYTGSAVGISSTSLSTDSGELTVKKLELTIANNTQDDIDNAELIVETLESDFSGVDLRSFTEVATVVGPGTSSGDGPGPDVTITNPNGITRDSDGSVYIAGFGDGTMRRLKDGYVTRMSTGLVAPGGMDVLPGSGFLFAVEQSNNSLIRLSTSGGAKFVMAGGGAAGSADGTGAAARFSAPRDVAVLDTTAYVADFGNNAIRKVTNLSGGSGVVTTLNTSPAVVGPAGVGGVTIGGQQWLAVVSTSTHKLFLVNPVNGQSFQIAGTGVPGFAEGPGDIVQFSSPSDVAAVGSSLYVCELNNRRIRQLSLIEGADPKSATSWIAKTIAGDGVSGAGDGPGDVARFATARHIAVDGSGALLVTDINNNRVRKVTPVSGVFPVTGNLGVGTGSVTVSDPDGFYPAPIVNGARKPFFRLGDMDRKGGDSTSVRKLEMNFLVEEGVGNFSFVISLRGGVENTSASLDAQIGAGSTNVRVRTIAGVDGQHGWVDGSQTEARFSDLGRCFYASGGLYIIEYDQGNLRRYDVATGITRTIGGVQGLLTSPTEGTGETAILGRPIGIWMNETATEGFLTVAGGGGQAVMRMTRSGDANVAANWDFSIIAGSSSASGNTVGPGTSTRFTLLAGIVADPSGQALYLCDEALNHVKRLAFTGGDKNDSDRWTSSHYVGSTTGGGGYINGTGGAALFSVPRSLALTPAGELIVGESSFGRVRRVNPAREVTLLAGHSSDTGYVDGSATTARFSGIQRIVSDGAYVYVLEQSGYAVRRVSLATGETKTVAGGLAGGPVLDGTGLTGRFNAYTLAYDRERGIWLSGYSIVLLERIVRNGAP